MNGPASLLTAQDLTIGYKSGSKSKVISGKLNLHLEPGQLVCLLGPNGAGKSTLMRTLAGLQPGLSGEVYIGEQPLSRLEQSDLARKLSLVLTEGIEAGNLMVNEVVALGRTPYTGWLGTLSSADYKKIDWALSAVDIIDYRQRRIHELSDGERQKVMLARALAQDTDLILLDEPTAHLDLPSRVEIMYLLHTLARQTGKAILLSTHELDLALQAADQLWIMNKQGGMATGMPEDLVLNGGFESAFLQTGFYFDKSSGIFTIHKEATSFNMHLSGRQDLVFWTRRALQREGISTNSNQYPAPEIEIIMDSDTVIWKLNWYGLNSDYPSLETLIYFIRQKRNE